MIYIIYLFKELSDEVTTSTNPVSSTKQSEKSESPKEESTSITAEFDASETLEDAVEQPKEEQVTERMTDNIQVNKPVYVIQNICGCCCYYNI